LPVGRLDLLASGRACTRQAPFWAAGAGAGMTELLGFIFWLIIELFKLISALLWLYKWVIIAAVVMSWLVAFNVVNPRNQAVRTIGEFLFRATEPLLRPIRNRLPNFGAIDFSPFVLLILVLIVQAFIDMVIIPILARTFADALAA
jgi:YggT family protein